MSKHTRPNPRSFIGAMERQELREICARRKVDGPTVERLLGCRESHRQKLLGHGKDPRTVSHGEAVLFRVLDARPDFISQVLSGTYVPGDAAPVSLDFLDEQRIVALLATVGGDPGTFAEYLEHVPEFTDRSIIAALVDKGYVDVENEIPRVTELGRTVFNVREVVEFWKSVGSEDVEHVRPLTAAEWEKLKRAA